MLTLSSVSLMYDDQPVLSDLSLEIGRGEFVCIIGGAGKSSLLKLLGGIEPPQQGQVLYEGVDIYHVNEHRYSEMQKASGFLFQDAALLANLSIFENVALPLRYHCRMSEHEIKNRISETFAQLEISLNSALRPAVFPLSTRKMVAFARALVLEPKLLFLDDPSGNIDRNARETVFKILLELKDNCTGVIVSQDLDLITQIADRILVLVEGKIIQDGTVREVFTSSDQRVQRIIAAMGRDNSSQSSQPRPERFDSKELP